MNSKILLLSIIIALTIVGLYQLVFFSRHEYPEYTFKEGQISDINLVSPFDFPILKSEEQLQQEIDEAVRVLPKPHSLDTEVEFSAYANLDELFAWLLTGAENYDWEQIKASAQNAGYSLNSDLGELNNRTPLIVRSYNTTRKALGEIYRRGLLSETENDSILFVSASTSEKRNTKEFYQLLDARQALLGKLGSTGVIVGILEDNLSKLLMPNLLLDEERYTEMSNIAKTGISTVSGLVKQNEEIIRKNQRLSEQDILKLNSLTREYQNRGNRTPPMIQLANFTGLLIFVFIILLLFNLLSARLLKQELQGLNSAIFLNMGFVALIGLSVIILRTLNLEPLHIPLAILVISSAVMLGYDYAILYTVTGVLLASPFLDWQAANIILLLASALTTLALMYRFKSRNDFLRIWMFLFVSLNLINLLITMYFFTGANLRESIFAWLRSAGISLVTTSVSVIASMAIIAYFERKWNLATKQVMLNLLDFNHPLLKKLATIAPGTYHHSLIVGNLAERSAEAIGANALLARVGSYYHDIGKFSSPEIYTENNEDSSDYHSRLKPEQSAEAIRNHVQEGAVLAAKYHLPKEVADIILQHHGTSYIRYFLNAALKNDEVVDPNLFKYPGPLPQTREAAIVMLADVVESTTKAKDPSSDEEIEKIIADTVDRLIRDGQFEEAPITMKDLATIKQEMTPILESIYRKRLDYPEDSIK